MITTFRQDRPVSLQTSRGAAGKDPQAWKKLIGNKPVAARLAVLPDGESRLTAVLTSAIFQTALVIFVVAYCLVYVLYLQSNVLAWMLP